MNRSVKNRMNIPLLCSLRTRIFVLVAIVVMGATVLITTFILRQFETVTKLEMEHEGILLSNALEASIILEQIFIPRGTGH